MAKNQNFVKGMLQNNLKSEGREMIDWMFFDSVITVASTTATFSFFQNTLGTVGVNRTNMKSAGQFPNPQSFAITEMGFRVQNLAGTPFFFAGGAAPTIHPCNVIFGSMTFKVKLEPSTDYEGYGFQFWDQLDYMNDTAAALGQQAYPALGYKTLKFKAPILIPPTRAFSVEATFTTPAAAQGYTAAGTPVYCWIKGLLRRNN